MSPFELWLRYFELGGMDSPLEVEAYLFGALQPSTHDHDLLVHALNERFAELGRGHPVPYSDPRLTLGDRSVVVKGRVAHCSITDVDQELVTYRSGIEFIEPSDRVYSVISEFIDAIKGGRSGQM